MTKLSFFGLLTPHDDIGLGQHCLGKWSVAWQHQAITNVDLTSLGPTDIHLGQISQETCQPSVRKISLEMTYVKFRLNWSEVNHLNGHYYHSNVNEPTPVSVLVSYCLLWGTSNMPLLSRTPVSHIFFYQNAILINQILDSIDQNQVTVDICY